MTELVEKLIRCYFCGEPIIKMEGRDIDSYPEHHISYVPEIKVPSHRGCHTRFHNSNKDYVKRPIRKPPKKGCLCYFCGEPIVKMNGRDSDSLIIHSLDGNHYNWNKDNKVPAHKKCHGKFHRTGKVVSKETREKIRKTSKGKHASVKTRKKMSLAKTGDLNPTKRPEVREKIRLVHTGKVFTKEHMKNLSLAQTGKKNSFFGKHHKPESIKKMQKSRKQHWANMTTEERAEHGRKVWEGRRKAKEKRKKHEI